MNLAENLIRTAGQRPDGLALVCGETRLTYAELDAASAGVAARLRGRGVGSGDAVGLMLPNVPEFAIAYYGMLRAGGVVVPMNVLLKQREVAFYLGDPQARLVFAWHEFAAGGAGRAPGRRVPSASSSSRARFDRLGAPAAQDGAEGGDDTAVILYTSGTTGKPKGAELTHRNLCAQRRGVRADAARLGPEDVVLGALPLFHSFGQTCGLNAAVASGASLALVPRFRPEAALDSDRARSRDECSRACRRCTPRCCTIPTRKALDVAGAATVRLRWRGAAGRGAARVRAARSGA